MNRRVLSLLAATTAAFAAWPVLYAALPLPSGTVPITGLFSEPVLLTSRVDLTVFSGRDLRGPLGTLAVGAACELMAWSREVFYVQGVSTRGTKVTGWADPASLSEIPPTLLDDARDAARHRKTVEAAIARKDVILGMTSDDVRAAMGKPDSVARLRTEEADSEKWSYIVYDRVPQRETYRDFYGFLRERVTYIRVPVSRRDVHFENGLVVAVEDAEEPAAAVPYDSGGVTRETVVVPMPRHLPHRPTVILTNVPPRKVHR